MFQTCVSGASMPRYPCSLHFDDEMECYCNTNFCNTPHLFHTEDLKILPIIACKEVHDRTYAPVSCNNCLRIMVYVKNRIGPSPSDDEELVQCSLQGEGSDFVFDTVSMREEMIGRNFFADSCYNVSMHKDHFYIYCRCTKVKNVRKKNKSLFQTDCNSPEVPIPYPLPPPTVSCYTSGYDGQVNPKKYEKPDTYFNDNYQMLMGNDSYVDENSTCRGGLCFVASVLAQIGENEIDIYYKGCISTNEQGGYSIQLKRDRYDMDKYPNQNTDLKDLNEEVNCNTDADSGDFLVGSSIYMPERLLRNFFAKACYNVSMHREHYYIHCRCVEPSCNTPETPNLPYPIIPGRTKCFTSGYDADVDNRNYEKPNVHYKNNYDSLRTNESFVDEGSECEGHYCFIAVYVIYINNGANETYYFKGCISANEQGDQKLSVIPDHLFL
ncbi:Protein CBG25136 [Caenorhabditis briggsae]|uniref:Protein CBG25136 n=1 Tax=Caenorhabditis briggsae TaxID=6238 RepID=A8X934_CAEBR|nr:Protein CBG25136 [Caenorhabditis briggsae]CAP29146.1 Protein CBG25136 [Caenorhabditis briggsae]